MLTKLDLCEGVIDLWVEEQTFQQVYRSFYWGRIESVVMWWIYSEVGIPVMEELRKILDA